ncbi:hypothetical protein J3A83DRAFT_4369343 [Scleroderma citrinum]
MNTITYLVSWLLAESPLVEDRLDTTHQACQLLCTVHDNTFGWVLELLEALENIMGDDQQGLASQLHDMAAICCSTFDVGDLNVTTQLLNSPRAIEILLFCAIIIHDSPSALLYDHQSQLLLEQDCHLLWRLQHVIGDIIEAGSEGIDIAVNHIWSRYHQGIHWCRNGPVNSTWFTARALGSNGQPLSQIYLDILGGSLLVDGKMVWRLPHIIQNDDLFKSIFGYQVMDVMPSNMSGMEYATCGLISGHHVCVFT